MLVTPSGFGCVETGVFRACFIEPVCLGMLESLGLKTIVSLNQGTPADFIEQFANDNDIQVIHIAGQPWRPSPRDIWSVRKSNLQATTNYALDTRYHPLLLLDSSNFYVGILRRLQGWSFPSILSEYRVFSGARTHYRSEVFLELVEIKQIPSEDAQPLEILQQEANKSPSILFLVLPPAERLPSWL